MGEILYGKLVRDKIPEIIRADGQVPVTRILGTEEFRRKLLEKLVEEAQELLESGGDSTERVDVEELLQTIDEVFGFDPAEIEKIRRQKAEKRGGFALQIYLEKAITND